jgi:hypothetical protein
MRLLATVMALAVSLPAVAHAQAERMSDKDVKALMDTIHDRRDRFEDALDGEFKHSVARAVIDAANKLDGYLAGKSLGAANSTMAEIKSLLSKISQGFGM